jgi:hypothetical protein
MCCSSGLNSVLKINDELGFKMAENRLQKWLKMGCEMAEKSCENGY